MSSKETELTPPDLKRCQGEWLAGSFMTLGPRHMERCTSMPAVIVTEAQPGADGRCGSMALCLECRDVLIKKMGSDYFIEEPIVH